MEKEISDLIDYIGENYKEAIEPNARHYREVSVGRWAHEKGYPELSERFKNAYAIVPLKAPVAGMKVRIDGRTFVDYHRHGSGIAIPGYIARAAGQHYEAFVPNESMILNYC